MTPQGLNRVELKRPKPKLRGMSHLLGALCAIPLGISLFRLQEDTQQQRSSTAAPCSCSCPSVLSITWSIGNEMRAVLRRVDRSMIYIFVAGTYTPILAGLGSHISGWVSPVVWTAAGLGVVLTVFVPGLPRVLVTGLYVALGWGAVMIMPAVMDHVGMQAFWFLTIGGFFYTVGATAYAFRPDLVPRIFGYHEVFHLCVLIAPPPLSRSARDPAKSLRPYFSRETIRWQRLVE